MAFKKMCQVIKNIKVVYWLKGSAWKS